MSKTLYKLALKLKWKPYLKLNCLVNFNFFHNICSSMLKHNTVLYSLTLNYLFAKKTSIYFFASFKFKLKSDLHFKLQKNTGYYLQASF